MNARDQIIQLILIAVDEMQRVWQVSDMVPGLPKDQINRGFNLTNQQEFFLHCEILLSQSLLLPCAGAQSNLAAAE